MLRISTFFRSENIGRCLMTEAVSDISRFGPEGEEEREVQLRYPSSYLFVVFRVILFFLSFSPL